MAAWTLQVARRRAPMPFEKDGRAGGEAPPSDEAEPLSPSPESDVERLDSYVQRCELEAWEDCRLHPLYPALRAGNSSSSDGGRTWNACGDWCCGRSCTYDRRGMRSVASGTTSYRGG